MRFAALIASAVAGAAMTLGAAVASASPTAPAANAIAQAQSIAGADVTRVGVRFRCVAVARRIDGVRLAGTRRVAHGRGACRRAFRRCDRALAHRQRAGLNPLARCVATPIRVRYRARRYY